MKRRALVSLAALAALLLSTGRASAEQDAGLRVRLGGSLEGGPFIVPGVVTVGLVGFDVHAGVQLNNLVAIYATVGGPFVVGKWDGRSAHFSLLVDLTFNDTISVSAGPVAHDVRAHDAELIAEGYIGGGRLHLAVCPPSFRVMDHYGRRGFTFGADVRLLFGTPNFVKHIEVFPPVTFPYKPAPMVSVILGFGYQVF
jgi:hypothetical protein